MHQTIILQHMSRGHKKTLDEDQLKKILFKIFDEYDKDGDERLNAMELREMLNSIYCRQTGKNNYLSISDVNAFIAMIDSNGDAELTKQ